jgi:sulfate transporter 3
MVAADDARRVPVPPPQPFLHTLGAGLKETLFPDNPLRYVFPCLGWLPSYSLGALRSDLVAGVTVASLAVPQGISYARLDPVIGLCKRP